MEPQFISELQPVAAQEGDHVTLSCVVIGQPHPRVSWYHGNKCLDHTKEHVIKYDKVSGLCELDIPEAFIEDSGTYRCLASNPIGHTFTKSELLVTPLSDSEESYTTFDSYSDFNTWKSSSEGFDLSQFADYSGDCQTPVIASKLKSKSQSSEHISHSTYVDEITESSRIAHVGSAVELTTPNVSASDIQLQSLATSPGGRESQDSMGVAQQRYHEITSGNQSMGLTQRLYHALTSPRLYQSHDSQHNSPVAHQQQKSPLIDQPSPLAQQKHSPLAYQTSQQSAYNQSLLELSTTHSTLGTAKLHTAVSHQSLPGPASSPHLAPHCQPPLANSPLKSRAAVIQPAPFGKPQQQFEPVELALSLGECGLDSLMYMTRRTTAKDAYSVYGSPASYVNKQHRRSMVLPLEPLQATQYEPVELTLPLSGVLSGSLSSLSTLSEAADTLPIYSLQRSEFIMPLWNNSQFEPVELTVPIADVEGPGEGQAVAKGPVKDRIAKEELMKREERGRQVEKGTKRSWVQETQKETKQARLKQPRKLIDDSRVTSNIPDSVQDNVIKIDVKEHKPKPKETSDSKIKAKQTKAEVKKSFLQFIGPSLPPMQHKEVSVTKTSAVTIAQPEHRPVKYGRSEDYMGAFKRRHSATSLLDDSAKKQSKRVHKRSSSSTSVVTEMMIPRAGSEEFDEVEVTVRLPDSDGVEIAPENLVTPENLDVASENLDESIGEFSSGLDMLTANIEQESQDIVGSIDSEKVEITDVSVDEMETNDVSSSIMDTVDTPVKTQDDYTSALDILSADMMNEEVVKVEEANVTPVESQIQHSTAPDLLSGTERVPVEKPQQKYPSVPIQITSSIKPSPRREPVPSIKPLPSIKPIIEPSPSIKQSSIIEPAPSVKPLPSSLDSSTEQVSVRPNQVTTISYHVEDPGLPGPLPSLLDDSVSEVSLGAAGFDSDMTEYSSDTQTYTPMNQYDMSESFSSDTQTYTPMNQYDDLDTESTYSISSEGSSYGMAEQIAREHYYLSRGDSYDEDDDLREMLRHLPLSKPESQVISYGQVCSTETEITVDMPDHSDNRMDIAFDTNINRKKLVRQRPILPGTVPKLTDESGAVTVELPDIVDRSIQQEMSRTERTEMVVFSHGSREATMRYFEVADVRPQAEAGGSFQSVGPPPEPTRAVLDQLDRLASRSGVQEPKVLPQVKTKADKDKPIIEKIKTAQDESGPYGPGINEPCVVPELKMKEERKPDLEYLQRLKQSKEYKIELESLSSDEDEEEEDASMSDTCEEAFITPVHHEKPHTVPNMDFLYHMITENQESARSSGLIRSSARVEVDGEEDDFLNIVEDLIQPSHQERAHAEPSFDFMLRPKPEAPESIVATVDETDIEDLIQPEYHERRVYTPSFSMIDSSTSKSDSLTDMSTSTDAMEYILSDRKSCTFSDTQMTTSDYISADDFCIEEAILPVHHRRPQAVSGLESLLQESSSRERQENIKTQDTCDEEFIQPVVNKRKEDKFYLQQLQEMENQSSLEEVIVPEIHDRDKTDSQFSFSKLQEEASSHKEPMEQVIRPDVHESSETDLQASISEPQEQVTHKEESIEEVITPEVHKRDNAELEFSFLKLQETSQEESVEEVIQPEVHKMDATEIQFSLSKLQKASTSQTEPIIDSEEAIVPEHKPGRFEHQEKLEHDMESISKCLDEELVREEVITPECHVRPQSRLDLIEPELGSYHPPAEDEDEKGREKVEKAESTQQPSDQQITEVTPDQKEESISHQRSHEEATKTEQVTSVTYDETYQIQETDTVIRNVGKIASSEKKSVKAEKTKKLEKTVVKTEVEKGSTSETLSSKIPVAKTKAEKNFTPETSTSKMTATEKVTSWKTSPEKEPRGRPPLPRKVVSAPNLRPKPADMSELAEILTSINQYYASSDSELEQREERGMEFTARKDLSEYIREGTLETQLWRQEYSGRSSKVESVDAAQDLTLVRESIETSPIDESALQQVAEVVDSGPELTIPPDANVTIGRCAEPAELPVVPGHIYFDIPRLTFEQVFVSFTSAEAPSTDSFAVERPRIFVDSELLQRQASLELPIEIAEELAAINTIAAAEAKKNNKQVAPAPRVTEGEEEEDEPMIEFRPATPVYLVGEHNLENQEEHEIIFKVTSFRPPFSEQSSTDRESNLSIAKMEMMDQTMESFEQSEPEFGHATESIEGEFSEAVLGEIQEQFGDIDKEERVHGAEGGIPKIILHQPSTDLEAEDASSSSSLDAESSHSRDDTGYEEDMEEASGVEEDKDYDPCEEYMKVLKTVEIKRVHTTTPAASQEDLTDRLDNYIQTLKIIESGDDFSGSSEHERPVTRQDFSQLPSDGGDEFNQALIYEKMKESLINRTSSSSDGTEAGPEIDYAELERRRSSSITSPPVFKHPLTMIPPTFIQPLKPQVIRQGEDALFEAKVKGTPVPAVKWRWNNASGTDQENITPSYEPETGICRLVWTSVDFEDSGNVACEATNKAGRARSTTNLVVVRK